MDHVKKAKELVDKFMPYMYCYMGSGMLSNDYDINVAFSYAKKCAIIAVNEIIEAIDWHSFETPNAEITYWGSVINEIELMQV